MKEVKDELREGDQILVKVLSIEGNRIKLSRKAVLREQRAKLGLPEPGTEGAQPAPPISAEAEDDVEDGDDFEDGEDEATDEPNFNRADGVAPAAAAPAGRGPGGGGPDGQRRPGGGRRRRGGQRPGSGGGGAPQGGGNR